MNLNEKILDLESTITSLQTRISLQENLLSTLVDRTSSFAEKTHETLYEITEVLKIISKEKKNEARKNSRFKK